MGDTHTYIHAPGGSDQEYGIEPNHSSNQEEGHGHHMTNISNLLCVLGRQ
jgi:hypothetical protein